MNAMQCLPLGPLGGLLCAWSSWGTCWVAWPLSYPSSENTFVRYPTRLVSLETCSACHLKHAVRVPGCSSGTVHQVPCAWFPEVFSCLCIPIHHCVSLSRSSGTWQRAAPNVLGCPIFPMSALVLEFHQINAINLEYPYTGHCIHTVCAMRTVRSSMLPWFVLVDQPSALCLPHASSAWCENTHECMPTWPRSPLVFCTPTMRVCMMVVGKMLAAEYGTSDCLLECLQGLCRTTV